MNIAIFQQRVEHTSLSWYSRTWPTYHDLLDTRKVINLIALRLPITKYMWHYSHNFVFIVFHDWIFNKRHTVAATSGIITSYPSGEHEFSLVFSGVHVVHFIQSHVFMLFARWCDIRYDFRLKKMLSSQFLSMSFVFYSCYAYVYWCPTRILYHINCPMSNEWRASERDYPSVIDDVSM